VTLKQTCAEFAATLCKVIFDGDVRKKIGYIDGYTRQTFRVLFISVWMRAKEAVNLGHAT